MTDRSTTGSARRLHNILEAIPDHLEKLWDMEIPDWEAHFRSQCTGLDDTTYHNIAAAACMKVRSLKSA